MVSTRLKNISQIGNLPQVGVKIKKWNHHLEIVSYPYKEGLKTTIVLDGVFKGGLLYKWAVYFKWVSLGVCISSRNNSHRGPNGCRFPWTRRLMKQPRINDFSPQTFSPVPFVHVTLRLLLAPLLWRKRHGRCLLNRVFMIYVPCLTSEKHVDYHWISIILSPQKGDFYHAQISGR